MSFLVTSYFAVAAFVAAWSIYGGILSRRRVKIFSLAEPIVLGATALAVGLIWVLFIPGMATVGLRHIRRSHAAPNPPLLASAREVRARG